MRIVIDMQGCQTESRFRGIGRYSLEFTKSVLMTRGQNEVILAFNAAFPESISAIREELEGLLPGDCIRVWSSPRSIAISDDGNSLMRNIAQALRTQFLNSLAPDIIHITSLFEGYLDDAVTDVSETSQSAPVSCHCYDLIPMLNPKVFLSPSPRYQQFYENKLSHLRKASLILTISESAKKEVADFFTGHTYGTQVMNVSAGIDTDFFHNESLQSSDSSLNPKFSIKQPFILYVGGSDPTKNLDRLISAYSSLPKSYVNSYQLVLAGRMPKVTAERLGQWAKNLRLEDDRLNILGHVSDTDLLGLYRSCRLFVCPSTHEGFGLPVLEAMACGAPVIASNTTSLPEVIDNKHALFDPYDDRAIRKKILICLENESFSNALKKKGIEQAKRFSWERVGTASWQAWQKLSSDQTLSQQTHGETPVYSDESLIRKSVSTVEKLVNKSRCNDSLLLEIASRVAHNHACGVVRQLLLDVSELCTHDSGSGMQRVVRGYLKNLLIDPPKDFQVRPVYATTTHDYRYADTFTKQFLGISNSSPRDDPVISWHRGDIFLALDCQHHVQTHHGKFYRRLQSDGVIVKFIVYDLLPIQYPDLFFDDLLPHLHKQWLGIVAKSDGAICISQATADSLEDWIASNSIAASPYFRIETNHIGCDLKGSHPSTGRPADAEAVLQQIKGAPSFLCVSTIEPRKQQELILSALELLWAADQEVNLVLVGKQGWKTNELTTYIRSHPKLEHRLLWLEGISDEFLAEVYQACSCVLLASLNEGFGLSLIEAAHHQKPIIARDIPVFREITANHAEYFIADTPLKLADFLESWLLRFKEGRHKASTGLQMLTWAKSSANLKSLLSSPLNAKRQLMVDISELIQRDAASGIQRVVKKICEEWLRQPPAGFRVELVYATEESGYRYAKAFTSSFMREKGLAVKDEPIECGPGDIFFSPDLAMPVHLANQSQLKALELYGVQIRFFLHDLLPIRLPQFFPEEITSAFSSWLNLVCSFKGVICNSKSTADELRSWLLNHAPEKFSKCQVNFSHLGANFSSPTVEMDGPGVDKTFCDASKGRIRFLMVGTIEPRKGHDEVLDAFDVAWGSGMDLSLLLVGKKGWMSETLTNRMMHHSEFGKRLTWLDSADDAELEAAYQRSDCFIAASHGEGFGIPLVEAASKKLPIIARDINIFREILQHYAFYFDSSEEHGLKIALREWVSQYSENRHPKSDNIRLLTWRQSTGNIFSHLTGQSQVLASGDLVIDGSLQTSPVISTRTDSSI